MHASLSKATDLDPLKFFCLRALWFLTSAAKPDDQWSHRAQQHHPLMAGLLHREGPETKCDISLQNAMLETGGSHWLIISCNVPAVWAVRTADCVTSAAGQAIPTCQSELEVLQHSRTWQSTSSYGLTLEKSSASMSITSAACDSLFCLSCVCLHFSHWLWFVLSIGPAGKCVGVAFGFSTATSKSMAITQNEWFVWWSSPFSVHKWFMSTAQNSLMWPLANVICKFLLESNSWSAGDHSNYHSC